MDPVTTGQIYWGAVPFVCIQVIMVILAIAFPQMIMHYRDDAAAIDPSQIEITLPPANQGSGDLSQPPVIDLSQPPEIDP
jgi:hypothetical protein